MNRRPTDYETENPPLSPFVLVENRLVLPLLDVQSGGFWMGNWMGKLTSDPSLCRGTRLVGPSDLRDCALRPLGLDVLSLRPVHRGSVWVGRRSYPTGSLRRSLGWFLLLAPSWKIAAIVIYDASMTLRSDEYRKGCLEPRRGATPAALPSQALHWNVGRLQRNAGRTLNAWLTSPMGDCHRSSYLRNVPTAAPAPPTTFPTREH